MFCFVHIKNIDLFREIIGFKIEQNHEENPKNPKKQTSGRNPRHKHKPLYARAFGFLVLVQLSRGKRRMRKMIKRRRSEGRGSGAERQGNQDE